MAACFSFVSRAVFVSRVEMLLKVGIVLGSDSFWLVPYRGDALEHDRKPSLSREKDKAYAAHTAQRRNGTEGWMLIAPL